MKDTAQLHPFGLRYYLLLIGAFLMRLSMLLRFLLIKEESASKLSKAGITCSRLSVPSREPHRSIKVDLYEKAGRVKTAKQHIHLNIHGSGFVIPGLGSDVDFCIDLASTGTAVFDTDYRKAPEHPFPAAYEDVQDVLKYIQGCHDDFDVTHITVSGFSAGGNLAMALTVNAPPGSVAGLVTIYGNTDMTTVYPAPDEQNFDSGSVIPEWLRRFFYRCYILPHQDRSDTRLSPAKAASKRWPKHVWMACGTADSLHEPARILMEDLRKDGHGDAEFLSVERESHGFDKNPKPKTSSKERKAYMYKRAIEAIERAQRD